MAEPMLGRNSEMRFSYADDIEIFAIGKTIFARSIGYWYSTEQVQNKINLFNKSIEVSIAIIPLT